MRERSDAPVSAEQPDHRLGTQPGTHPGAHPAPGPRLGVLSDETGASLDTCIAFAVAQGFEHIEVRMVDGIAPLSLTEAEARDAARRIQAAGLFVSGIATPLLKWAAPGKTAADAGDQFGFARDGRSDDDLIAASIRLADIFETRNLRIFSYLTHAGFALDDVKPAYDHLLDHAERFDKVLRIENEPVCNIARFDQLADVLEHYNSPRLEGIPDIANSASVEEFPDAASVARVLRHSSHIHFKDWSGGPLREGRYVPLGTGVVDLKGFMAALAAASGGRQLTFSIETHCPDDPLAATEASAAELIRRTAQHWPNAATS